MTETEQSEALIADLRARLAHLQAQHNELSQAVNHTLESGATVRDADVAAFIDSLRQERSRLWAEARDHQAAQARLLVKIAGVAGERDEAREVLGRTRDMLEEARAELAAWDSVVADERDALLVEVARLHSECRDAHERIARVETLIDPASEMAAFAQGSLRLFDEKNIRAALGPDGEAQ